MDEVDLCGFLCGETAKPAHRTHRAHLRINKLRLINTAPDFDPDPRLQQIQSIQNVDSPLKHTCHYRSIGFNPVDNRAQLA
jgi:hypothetical protein